jgi:hypothetical protein
MIGTLIQKNNMMKAMQNSVIIPSLMPVVMVVMMIMTVKLMRQMMYRLL